ncbi:methyltransferase domain-containing protein [Mesorhizobium sp. M8A.F.Ca.ET.057.01.1.1]|nr:methyltransferase domain-containing protein [Mesorhizobium sp. M8A.F.Ca.ET.057.01.1.1]RWE42862.1 MAG: methyltransferase domain-containing protein [Mesorhizobium sp.]
MRSCLTVWNCSGERSVRSAIGTGYLASAPMPEMETPMMKVRQHFPAPGMVDFGDLDSVEPLSRAFGGDRGRPLDRYYIESFLERHAADIKGRVAEIGDNVYTRRFGGERVVRSDIIDSPQSANPSATIKFDLQREEDIEAACFDCMIVTQTLHMIYDVRGALATVHRALAPGGVVLATIPGITPIDAHDGPEKWFWTMTQSAARRLFEERFGRADVVAEQFGNVLAATAFLQGLAFEEIDRADLDVIDPLYPVITGIRASKPMPTRVV